MFSNKDAPTLDMVLQYAQRAGLMTVKSSSDTVRGCHFPYDSNCVVVGRFAFQVHCHDTGNSVRGYILTDDKPYEIINATFWKRSGYEHNKDKWEKGAWDTKLSQATQTITSTVQEHQIMAKKAELEYQENINQRNQETKREVEELFK